MYCGIKAVPRSYAVGTGSFENFTWESAFWVFNFVSNYAYSRYQDMIKDIQLVQRKLEGRFLADQPEIEKAALELHKKSPQLAREYLTEYSIKLGDQTVKRWKKLGEFLIFKYLDGNVKDELGKVTHPGYPDDWYRRIIKERGEHFRYKKLKGEKDNH
jgi:dipeptidase